MSEYSRFLVTTDFSEEALPGVVEAGSLARRLGSRIDLLYVVEDRMPALLTATSDIDRRQLLDRHRRTAEESLGRYAAKHLEGCQVEVVVRVGSPVETILETAEERGSDLIVMATHGYGFVRHALFGSTTQRVLHHARCPVLVVRSRREESSRSRP